VCGLETHLAKQLTDALSFSVSAAAAGPNRNLVFDAAGNLYGIAATGGNASCTLGGCGTIFELSPPSAPGGDWTEATLYTFIGGTDGIYPNEYVIAVLIFGLIVTQPLACVPAMFCPLV
jgi:hypothetical protein